MKFTLLLFVLIHATALSLVHCNGESVKNRKLIMEDPEVAKKEKIFLGDDSLSFGYASSKLSFGGAFNGYNGLGFGGHYRPFYSPYGANFYGGGLYGGHFGGHIGGIGGHFGGHFGGIGLGFPGKHHHHKFHHHAFGGYHQPYYPGFGYY